MSSRIDWSGVDFSLSDEENARLLQCSVGSVKSARLRRRKLRPTSWRSMPRISVDWADQPLGLEPDHVIARRLGVHQETVERARTAASIPPCITIRVPIDLPIHLWEALRRMHPNSEVRDAVLQEIRDAVRR